MALYACRVSDSSGNVSRKVFEANDEDSLARTVGNEGLLLLGFSDEYSSRRAPSRSVPANVVMEFTRTLDVLLQAQLPLEDSLEVAASALSDGRARALVSDILTGLRKGEPFSSRLELYPRSFPPVYRGMVRIGERTGRLEPMFRRIASYMEDQKKIRDKISGSLIYPAIVIGLVAVGLACISIFLAPALERMFKGMGIALPPRTAAAIALLGGSSRWLAALIAVIAAAAAARSAAARRKSLLARRIDSLLLGLPVYGRYTRLRDALSFSFAMEALVSAGIPVEAALGEAALVVGNRGIAGDLALVRDSIEKGEPLSSAFASCRSLPRQFSTWARIGERTGSVESIFSQTRVFFQYELDSWSSRFMALVEPALVILVGGLLISIVLLFIVPFLTSFTSIL